MSNFNIGVDMSFITRLYMQCSASTIARRSLGALYTSNILELPDIQIPKEAKNKNAEICGVYLKTAGYRMQFEIDYSDEDPDYVEPEIPKFRVFNVIDKTGETHPIQDKFNPFKDGDYETWSKSN